VRTAAVLPVKRFGRAKSRLGGIDRAELAAAMVEDVLAALALVPGLDAVVVVSSEPSIDATVADPQEHGHVAAAQLGITHAVAGGAERVLLVPGDCPALDPVEVGALLAEPFAGVTIVPDRHGTGTNALLLAPPEVMVPSFGPGSFARHAALARAAGARIRVAEPASLTHDVDTREDLASLAAYAEATGAAPRTRALLGVLA
jgi:2-phospho-L-lactate guanylyltransferase